MPNPVKILGYIKYYNLISPRPIKTQAILPEVIVRKYAVGLEDLTPYWKSEKRSYFSKWSRSLLFTSFPDAYIFDKSTLGMTFSTNLLVTETLCSFRLVLSEETGKKTP